MKSSFFARMALPILLVVFFLVPFSIRGARVAVKDMKNEIAEWLPKNFQESHEMNWFWRHFMGERFIIVSWPGCTGDEDDQSFKLLVSKLSVETPPSRQRPPEVSETATTTAIATPAEDVETRATTELTGEASTADTNASGKRFGQNLERPYEFIGDKLALFSTGEYYENWGSRQEKWLQGKGDRWYYITANGELYAWNEADAPIASFGRRCWRLAFGGQVEGEHVASLGPVDGPWYYANPRRLDAQLFRSVATGPAVLDYLAGEGGVLENNRDEAVNRLTGSLYGPDGKQTCLMLYLTDVGTLHFHRVLGRGMMGKSKGRLIELASESGVSYENLKLGGPAVDNVAIDEEGTITLVRLVSLCALLGLGLAYMCFRSITATLIVFFIGGVSAITSIAFVGWFGCSIDAILMSMPALVYVLGISGAVHIINYYREAVDEHGHAGAPERAVSHGWKPALLCNLTTAIGLVSLCTSELSPIRKFGLFSALGVMATLILLFSYLPAALQFFPQKRRTPVQRQRAEEPWYEKYLSRFWETMGGGIIRHHYLVAGACIFVILATGYGVTRINTSVNLLKMFDSKSKILQDYAWLEENLGKLVPMEIVVKVAPSSMRKPVSEQTGEQPADPDEAYRLSFLERMEIVDRVQKVVEQEFGASGQGITGRSLSAVTFSPPMPQAKGDNFTFARRGATNARLEAHRSEFLGSEYLRTDKEDLSELWRISVRVGALQDVDYGTFINELKCAVEPVLAAQRERERILRSIVAQQNGKRHVGAKVLLVGAPLGPAKKSGAMQATPRRESKAGDKYVVDQTRVFAQSLAELLTIARLKLDWHDPQSEVLPSDWDERLAKYDCVVLVGDHRAYDLSTIKAKSTLFVDAREHTFDPTVATNSTQVAVAGSGQAVAAIPASAIPAAEPSQKAGISSVYTGVIPIVYKAQRSLLNSLIQSTFWSFITITPLMMFVSRSFSAGMVAMLPNVLPVLVIFGSMGWLNIAVDIGSMMTASIALGVAVDDTIHYLSWYRQELNACGNRHQAILATYKRCATPTLQAAVISGLGLSIFALSTFTPTQRFGCLMLSILWAGVVAELIFFPALLAGPLGLVFKPNKKGGLKPAHGEAESHEQPAAGQAQVETVRAEKTVKGPHAAPEPAAQPMARPHLKRGDAPHVATRRGG